MFTLDATLDTVLAAQGIVSDKPEHKDSRAEELLIMPDMPEAPVEFIIYLLADFSVSYLRSSVSVTE